MTKLPTMYAIADKHNENCYWDAKEKDVNDGLKFSCLFPSEEVAVMVIEEELSDDFEVVPVANISMTMDGTFSYDYKDIWNNYKEDDEKTYVNPEDKGHYEQGFDISLYNYEPFQYVVYGSDAQQALDTLVDWLEKQGTEGYFLNEESIKEKEVDNLDIIYAGNHSRALDPEHTVIKELE